MNLKTVAALVGSLSLASLTSGCATAKASQNPSEPGGPEMSDKAAPAKDSAKPGEAAATPAAADKGAEHSCAAGSCAAGQCGSNKKK